MKKTEKKVTSGKQAGFPGFPSHVLSAFAEEVAKLVIARLPHMPGRGKKKKQIKNKHIEHAIFFDTSAIIDGRIFDVIKQGLLSNVFVVPEPILLELKHIADSHDVVKKERGRRGLEKLEALKKTKGLRIATVPYDNRQDQKRKEVDERLIALAKQYKGKIITCDYNLEKKATIQGVLAINVNAIAQALKVSAVPGEAVSVKILHQGKDPTQGVGYLDDGTMIVVEHGVNDVGKDVDVVVSRVIQTAAGRILFAKKI
ncbi:MAG: TRAM domain-containing protein [Candidatus Levybacteria bacterium]|nr:TRAM domain-containing protein [Candidatus Levybacteria bacterium]